jgi:hypothetical protein
MRHVVYETELAGFPIKLEQSGKDRFTVIYGRQIDQDISYRLAAARLGEAMMHALTCEGKIRQ